MARRGAQRRKVTSAGREGGPSARVILDAASRILVEEGPAALTMRRLATESGTSTMVLYTRFANRDAMMDALLGEGFSRFADALGAVSNPEPNAHLRELGRAYRRFALENPIYYRMMWSGGPLEVEWRRIMGGSAASHGSRAFSTLVLAITRVLALHDRSARDAEPLAMSVWSLVHGFVSLELSGCTPRELDADRLYERALDFALAGLSPSK